LTVDALLTTSFGGLLADHQDLGVAQHSDGGDWAADLWHALAEGGFPWISIPEAAGGSGGSLADAMEIVRLTGYHAAAVPLSETILASWIIAEAGLSLPDGPLTLVPGTNADTLRCWADSDSIRLEGCAYRVPWAAQAKRIVIALPYEGGLTVALVDPTDTTITSRTSLAGEPRDDVQFDAHCPTGSFATAAESISPQAILLRGALTRVMLIAGALERVAELTIQYTSERRQFGRPVRAFQAVQQHLVHCTQESAIVCVAAAAAVGAAAGGPAAYEIAAAKLLANAAARKASRAAHQAHGAIGCTQEYALHQFTRRLWCWGREYGDDAVWSARLGHIVLEQGPDNLYPLITSGSEVVDFDAQRSDLFNLTDTRFVQQEGD
jgi:acyl-CoA dehydrogenase